MDNIYLTPEMVKKITETLTDMDQTTKEIKAILEEADKVIREYESR